MNEYMNEHKQLLSFSPKTSTIASDFNLFGELGRLVTTQILIGFL